MTKERPSILLVTSNGTGMGHLTRQSAIARALDDQADVTILSLSSGISVIIDQGLRAEYVPSYHLPLMPRPVWNNYLRDRIVHLAQELAADVIAFDGVAPYRGLLAARLRLPNVGFVWFRRGMWKPGRNEAALQAESFFDLVITPGDFSSAADRGLTVGRPSEQIEPISLLDVMQPLSRDAAANELGLDPSRSTALITIGSGALGDNSDAVDVTAEYLTQLDWQVASTKAVLDQKTREISGVRLLNNVYPLAKYVNAFDVVVSAAGYNAVHEFIAAGIPTLLIPNSDTATDDQLGRARQAAQNQVAEWVDPVDGIAGLKPALDRTIKNSDQLSASASLMRQKHGGGTQQAAALLIGLARSFTGDKPNANVHIARSRTLLRGSISGSATQIVGPQVANAVRSRLRRKLDTSPPKKLSVDVLIESSLYDRVLSTLPANAAENPNRGDSRPLTMSTTVPSALLREGAPVEHVLPGTSVNYLTQRLSLLRHSYRVQSVDRAPVDTP